MRAVTSRRLVAAMAASLVFSAGGFDARAIDLFGVSCSIDSTSPIVFGRYDPNANGPVDAQGQVVYRCRRRDNRVFDGRGRARVQISLSTGLTGTYDRRMWGARDRLQYNVYLDATRHVIWGDGTRGTSVITDEVRPDNDPHVVPAFGRLFANQDVWYGLYGDNLVVTLDF